MTTCQGVFVLLLSLTLVSADESDQVRRAAENELLAATKVHCLPREQIMYVTVERSAMVSYGLNGDDVSISFTDASNVLCTSSSHESDKFKLATKLNECETQRVEINGNVVYRNKITLKRSMSDNSTETFNELTTDIACQTQMLQPADEPTRPRFELEFFTNGWTVSQKWFEFPRRVTVGTTVYVQVTLKDQPDADLQPLPIDCFFTDNSRVNMHDRHKQMMLRSSCPFAQGVAIYHDAPGPSFRFSYHQPDGNTMRSLLFMHCKVVVCSVQGGRQEEGYANCPPPTDCTDNTVMSTSSFPQEPQIGYITSGPVMPVEPKRDVDNDDMCPPCAELEQLNSQRYHDVYTNNRNGNRHNDVFNNAVVVHDGLSTAFVVFVAVISFIIGMVLVGALWWIHDTYAPPLSRPSSCSDLVRPVRGSPRRQLRYEDESEQCIKAMMRHQEHSSRDSTTIAPNVALIQPAEASPC